MIDQMQEAIPAADWVEEFRWKEEKEMDEGYWLLEEILGFDLVLRFAELNELSIIMDKPKYNLKMFLQSAYDFVNYDKPDNFEGFDWFLSTVFIICGGDANK